MKWTLVQDLDVCCFYLLNQDNWRDRLTNYHNVFCKASGFDVPIGTLKMRIQNYQYIHTKGAHGLSKTCKQERSVYNFLTSNMLTDERLTDHKRIMLATEEEYKRNLKKSSGENDQSNINFIEVNRQPDKMDFYTLMYDLGKKYGYDTRYKIAKAAHIDQGAFRKNCENNSMPDALTVAKLCIGMHLPYEEAKLLFKKAYRSLSGEDNRDVLLDYCMENGIFDTYEIDMTLLQKGFKPLFDKSLDKESLKEYIENLEIKKYKERAIC